MVDAYRTDEEQVEALKKWWRDNGQSTAIAVLLAVAGVFGWQAWQKQQLDERDAAAAVYQNLVTAAGGNGGQLSDEQLRTAKHLAASLRSDFGDSTYARFAALYEARFAVEAGDLATAEQSLRWVLEQGTTPELTLLTKLRLARVLASKPDYPAALALLEGDATGFTGAYEELRGDILSAQGDFAAAAAAYQRAIDFNATLESGVTHPLLDAKLQQVQGAQSADTKAADAPAATVSEDAAGG